LRLTKDLYVHDGTGQTEKGFLYKPITKPSSRVQLAADKFYTTQLAAQEAELSNLQYSVGWRVIVRRVFVSFDLEIVHVPVAVC
jgi:hypothetical protein